MLLRQESLLFRVMAAFDIITITDTLPTEKIENISQSGTPVVQSGTAMFRQSGGRIGRVTVGSDSTRGCTRERYGVYLILNKIPKNLPCTVEPAY